MKKKRYSVFFLSLLMLLAANDGRSQNNTGLFQKMELSYGIGTFFLLGDLGGNPGTAGDFIKDFNFKSTKLSMSFDAQYPLKKWLTVGMGLSFGKLESDDESINNKGGGEMPRIIRNLNARTNITELHAIGKFYPKKLFKKTLLFGGRFDFFAIAGLGIYHFDPAVQDTDRSWVKASPLKLEGQGFAEYPNNKPYALTQFNLQGGAGLRYDITKNISLGVEIIYRKLFTDYLDDVSTVYIDPSYFDKYLSAENAVVAKRVYYKGIYPNISNPGTELTIRGDPTDNDAFISENFTLSWRFANKNGRISCPKR